MATETLIRLYGIGVGIAFLVYLTLFLRDRETPLSDVGSWFVLLFASLFWPLVLPISLKLELLPRWRRTRSNLISLQVGKVCGEGERTDELDPTLDPLKAVER